MDILILGGTGLISTGITRLLAARGDAVTVFNRGSTPHALPEQVRVVHGSRDDPDALRSAAQPGFDAVVDMICYTPEDARLAVEAFGGRAARYVLCSTVDVYTTPAVRYPIDETHPREPSDAFTYAFDKARCEELLLDAEREGAFALTILRPAATYERGIVAPLGTAALYLDRLRRGLPIVLHGDGTSLWVATHRDDVARAFVGALDNPSSAGRAYNVASDELLTWQRYWEIAAEAVGAPEPRIVHVPTDVLVRLAPDLAEWCELNFQHHNLLDSSAARRDLGFDPRVRWAEGARGLAEIEEPPTPELAARYDRLLDAWSRLVDELREV